MKLIIALILALSLCVSAYILSYNPKPDNLIERIESVEAEMRALRVEFIGYKAEIRERTRPYTHIIPVDGGLLGVRQAIPSSTSTTIQPN